MAEEKSEIPKRFEIARRWQWPAALASALFFLSCLIGWPFGLFWPSVIGLILFIPAAALFSIKCYACGYPAFSDYQADEKVRLDIRPWTRFWGKEYGGLNLPLERECSKCSAQFVREKD